WPTARRARPQRLTGTWSNSSGSRGSSVAEDTYTDLTIEVRRDEDQGVWKFGVTLDGAFVPFAVRKLGGVDDDIVRALEEATAAKAKAFAPPTEASPPPSETPPEPPPVPPVTE